MTDISKTAQARLAEHVNIDELQRLAAKARADFDAVHSQACFLDDPAMTIAIDACLALASVTAFERALKIARDSMAVIERNQAAYKARVAELKTKIKDAKAAEKKAEGKVYEVEVSALSEGKKKGEDAETIKIRPNLSVERGALQAELRNARVALKGFDAAVPILRDQLNAVSEAAGQANSETLREDLERYGADCWTLATELTDKPAQWRYEALSSGLAVFTAYHKGDAEAGSDDRRFEKFFGNGVTAAVFLDKYRTLRSQALSSAPKPVV